MREFLNTFFLKKLFGDYRVKRTKLKYCYVDESYKKFGGYHHCIVGGLVINPVHVIKINLAINDILNEKLVLNNQILGMQEMHLNDLFPEVPDDEMKFEVLNSVIREVSNWDFKIFTFHLKYPNEEMKKLMEVWKDYEIRFMYRATFLRLYPIIKNHYKGALLQTIVDAGFDRSFKKQVHPVYMFFKEILQNSRIFQEQRQDAPLKDIEAWDFTPVFTDSRDERLIQLVDMVIGKSMWQIDKNISPFKQKVTKILSQLDSQLFKYEDTMKININV